MRRFEVIIGGTGLAGIEAAEATLREASDGGVDLAAITRGLERDGVRAFCDSYQEPRSLIESVLRRVTVSR